MSEVFTSTVAKTLKKTLNEIVDDDLDGLEANLIMPKWMKVMSMEDAFEDDVEYAGGGLVSEKPEGSELASITMKEGYTTRYLAKTFGAKMAITEETMEDCKYKQVIDLARRLKRSLFKTVDIDATLVLMRYTNAAYVGGDGLSLANAAHTLPNGGTFSNVMATPLSPSMQALAVVQATLDVMPGHDGITEGYAIKKVLYPSAQWSIWKQILQSKLEPVLGNYAAINTANKFDDGDEIQPCKIRYWSNSTTNWGCTTSADNGLSFRWRRRPRGKSWVENDNEVMKYSTSARWDRKWSDPRGFYGIPA